MDDTLVIIDGHSWINRAYFSLRNLSNKHGFPTGAIYGFRNMLRTILNKGYTNICVTFDGASYTHRHEFYPQYKANRSKSGKTDMYKQIPIIQEYLRYNGITYLSSQEYEADDIIYTLVGTFKQDFKEIIIYSADKDLLQMVTDNITVIDTNSSNYTVYTPRQVELKFGIKPENMIDYLSIVGDTSDNIPGAKGIGKVSAVKLIQKYGKLIRIKIACEKTPDKLQQKFLNQYEQIKISQKLVQLLRIQNLPVTLQDLKKRDVDQEAVNNLLNKLDIRN